MAQQSSMTPWGDPDADPAHVRAQAEAHGGDAYARLHALHRELDAALAGSGLTGDAAMHAAQLLEQAVALARTHAVGERRRFDGMRPDLPGRGHPGLPPYVIDEAGDGVTRGRVTFSRFHLGGNGAVHGGCHPLLFDDVLGHVTNHRQPVVARTAYLHVNYRSVTPYDVELRFDCTLDRHDGRKRLATGRLVGPDGTLLADAEGLFVELLPGQP